MKKTNAVLVMLLATCLAFAGCTPAPEEQTPAASDTAQTSATPQSASAAADWLASQLAAEDNTLWVYRDFDDGLNNFTQKAWMGDTNTNIPTMDEAAPGYSGISGIEAHLDLTQHAWGGYMFLSGSLAPGETDPSPDYGSSNAAVDLTGATKLVFYAKGATGQESVELFMGGFGWENNRQVVANHDSVDKITLGTVQLSQQWQRFEIAVTGVDLSRIGCGFGWVTNDTSNPGLSTVDFSLDDIHYEFAESRTRPMFLQSYASAAPGTDDAIINNFAYLYDNAVAALALAYAGNQERAQQIADAIVYAYGHDRYFSDGRLRNAYASGNPASFPGWESGKGEAFARLPGFYSADDKAWYEDYYAVSTSTGNLAWAILALCEVSKSALDGQAYLSTAEGIADFVLTLKSASCGFTGGYEGWEGSQTKVGYKSTEHNIDLISAFGKLGELTGEQKYLDAADSAKAFVMSMYDPERGCFYTGTQDDGVTVNKDVLPLDCNTWAILALKDDLPDTAQVLAFIEGNMAVGDGFDFNTDRDGVWFEGTAQAALAYQQSGDSATYLKLIAYLNASAAPDGSITAADRDGVTTGFTVSGTDIPWNYNKRTHVGATAWLAFAELGVNPL